MTKLQRRGRKRFSRRSQREKAGGADCTRTFPGPSSTSSPPASVSSRVVSLLSQLRPVADLERRFQRLSTHGSGQQWLPLSSAATAAKDVTASLPEELPAKVIMNLPAELRTQSKTKLAGPSAEPPAKRPVDPPVKLPTELPAEPMTKKPTSTLSSPSLSSLFSWAPASSSIAPTQEVIAGFEKSFRSSLPTLQILNTRESIPPHDVTEVFSVVRLESTIINTASIFVMKHITNESSRSGSFVLSYPLSLNDIESICKYPLRSSLSGSRTLYEVAIPPQMASALMAFELCNISFGDTVTERKLLPYTVSRMVRPFWATLVRKRDPALYRFGRPLCESMLYALLNRNEMAARWFWKELMRLTKISKQYAKAYHGMSSCIEDPSRTGCSLNEKSIDSWGPEHSWLRFWIIDRVNPYKKFPVSSLINIDGGVEKEISSFMRSSSDWPTGRKTVTGDDTEVRDKTEWIPRREQGCTDSSGDLMSSKLAPYVHNIFSQASLYVGDDNSICDSEYSDIDQQQAEKPKSILASADQDSEDKSDTIEAIDRIYSFWSYRARSARRVSVR